MADQKGKKEPVKTSRRNFIAAGAGIVVVAAVGGAAYYLTQGGAPPPLPTTATMVSTEIQTQTQMPSATVTAKGPVYGDILKFNLPLVTANFDPHNYTSNADAMVVWAVYDSLIKYDEQFNFIPWLAEKWEISADSKSVTFYLRNGVMWQNDREMTADDVAYSLDRCSKTGYGKSLFAYFESAEVIDKYTVRLNNSRPFYPTLATLANPAGRASAIAPKLSDAELSNLGISRDDFDKVGFATIALGTGPFKLVERTPGQFERFVKFPNYWAKGPEGEKQPYADGLLTVPQSDPSVILTHLETGVIDLMPWIDPKDVEPVKKLGKYQVKSMAGNYWDMLGFDHTKEPWTDERVRQALHYAINKQEVVDIVFLGQGEAARSCLPSWNKYYKAIEGWDYNPDKAKQLLADAGYKDGITGDLLTFDSAPDVDIFKVVQQQLARSNFNVNLKPLDIATLVDAWKTGKPEHLLKGESWTDKFEPWTSICSRLTKNGSVWVEGVNFESPETDSLVDEIASEFDENKRTQLIDRFQQIWMDTPITIPICWQPSLAAWANYLKNVEMEPSRERWNYGSMWIDRSG